MDGSVTIIEEEGNNLVAEFASTDKWFINLSMESHERSGLLLGVGLRTPALLYYVINSVAFNYFINSI